jgi:hypothetical protein
MKNHCVFGALLIVIMFCSLGCVEEKEDITTTEPSATTKAPETTKSAPILPPTTPAPTTAAPTTLPPLVPPSTPSRGKGNIIGKVYWNDTPVIGAEVKLCERFSTFGRCSGREYSTKTDAEGTFFINNVDPGEYVVLTRSPGEELWTYRMEGLGALKDTIVAGETRSIRRLDTIRSNLIILAPEENAIVEETPVLAWQPYEEAAYYELHLTYNTLDEYLLTKKDCKRVGSTFDTGESLSDPLRPGEYTWWLEAYNKNGTKIVRCSDYCHFTVAGIPPIIEIISPKDDETVTFPLTLRWEEWPEASYYKVYVARSTPSYEAILNYIKVDEITYVIEELEEGRYCWRVDVYDIDDTKIATSGTDLFYFIVE